MDNIKSIRMARNISQEDMAAGMKISQNAYSKLEKGYTQLYFFRILQIAEILKLEWKELMDIPDGGKQRNAAFP